MIYATFYFQGDTQWLRMNPQKIILKQYSSSANSVRLFGPWTLPTNSDSKNPACQRRDEESSGEESDHRNPGRVLSI